MPRIVAICIAAAAAAAACGDSDPAGPPPQRLKLWHTFNPHETEALNDVLADGTVETTLLSFARGQTILQEVLEESEDCPDLARIDATWLPGLARAGLLAPVPGGDAASSALVPEAVELGDWDGVTYGIPQTLDGLALIYDEEAVRRVIWPPRTIGELLAGAHRLTRGDVRGLGVRVDGYWYVAFLRAFGGDVIDPVTGELGIDTPAAERALERFADLFAPDGVAPPPPPSGSEARDEIRRFRAGKLPIVLNGPWALYELTGGAPSEVGVAAFPDAPRGGQVFVVPTCARHPADAWQLARRLTAPALQSEWARSFGTVPTRAAALDGAGEPAQSFYTALQQGRPLPRHPVTAELFDDLNPAVAAVVAGDATAEEALAGVARAWSRLLRRYEVDPVGHRPPRDGGAAQAPDAGADGGAP